MQAVTSVEMEEVLAQYPGLFCVGRELRFDHPEAKFVTLKLNCLEPHQLVELARLAAHLFYQEQHFAGAALWITQSGVWTEPVESVARNTIERIRQGYGENRSLEVAPGHFFRSDEFVDSVSLLLQPMLVGWDAFYVPRWTSEALDYFLFVSHDSLLEIHTRTAEASAKATQLLASLKWIQDSVGNSIASSSRPL